MTLSLLMYPVLRSLALQMHAAVTGSYISGTHSIAFINCLNEQIAKDIARYREISPACLLELFESSFLWNKAFPCPLRGAALLCWFRGFTFLPEKCSFSPILPFIFSLCITYPLNKSCAF